MTAHNFVEETLLDDSFLLRRITHTPDAVTIHNDIQIRWLQEAGFDSYLRAPSTLFGRKPLTAISMDSDRMSIDLQQWSEFVASFSSIFRQNTTLRQEVGVRIQESLGQYNNLVQQANLEWNKTQKISPKTLSDLFILMAEVDSFALFNIFLPRRLLRQQIATLGLLGKVEVDDFLVSMTTPHRNRVRKMKLGCALRLQSDPEFDFHSEMENVIAFDGYEDWVFDSLKADDPRILRRELRRLSSIYSSRDLVDEISALSTQRLNVMTRHRQALFKVYTAAKERLSPTEAQEVFERFLFLAVIATEEEQRHMSEATHFLVLGRVLRALQLDPARSSISEIVQTAAYIWTDCGAPRDN